MKIPQFVLKFKCTITPILGLTPNGKSYGTAISDVKCYVEHKIKWRGNSQKTVGIQHEDYTMVIFQHTSDIPDEIKIDGKVVIEGDSKEYTIVDAQKYRQITDEHWEVILR